MADTVNIELPFSGFYESIHDEEIDRAVEEGFTYDYDKDEDIELTDEVSEAIWAADVDWKAIRREYCEHYTDAFGERFGLTLSFDGMTSPREYNFSSDKIFCKAPREQIDKIRKEVEAHTDWPEYIKENFSSHSGFWSNYSADYRDEDWTRETLDECQYRTILEFWITHIELDTADGCEEIEWQLLEDFEMSNWDSIMTAQDTIEKYLKEEKSA